MTLSDNVNKAVNYLSHPGQSNEESHPIEHPAHHGASLEHHEPPEGLFERLTGEETTKLIQSQGNNGVGMEDGLRAKAIQHQEHVAERSRLRAEGLFEPHTKHEDMLSMSPEHRDVANGAKVVFDNDGEGTSRD